MTKKIAFKHMTVAGFMPEHIDHKNSSPDEKVDEALHILEVATDKITEAKQKLSETMLESVQSFKFETVKINGSNERRISDFKLKIEDAKKEVKAKYIQKAENMDIRNSHMRMRLEDHDGLGNEQWDAFMFGFNKDMEKLEKALKLNLTS